MNAESRRFPAGIGHERSQQFRFRSHDADLAIRYLDTLCECAQVILPIAAASQPLPVVGHAGEGFEHIGPDRLVAGEKIAGVLITPRRWSFSRALDELAIIALASDLPEWEDCIVLLR